jgi:hypothetical protein
MDQGLCALIRSTRLQSFCVRRLGVSLLMGLIVLWPVAAPGATTGEPALHTLVTTQVRRLWERDVPFVLRSIGVIHQPPEYVARQALFALDRHDLAGIMRFVDHSAPSAHQQVSEALQSLAPRVACVNRGSGEVLDHISRRHGSHRFPKGVYAVFLSHSHDPARRMN